MSKLETIAVSGGLNPKDSQNAISPPIYQTTAFEFESIEHVSNLFDLKEEGHIYTRISNPTTSILEQRLNELEGGVGALCVSSGQSASLISILNIVNQGDEVIASSSIYGGTFNLFKVTLKKYGINVKLCNSNDANEYEKLITDNTKCIFVESITNPQVSICDIENIANVAHKHNIPLIVDNTIATPYLLRPFEFGADIVVYSTTKYISGNGNAMGGAIIDSGNFDWTKNKEKFAQLIEPDESYHGVSYVENFKNAAYIVKARVQLLRDLGCTMSPFNAYLTLIGLETLHLRMQRHCENALKVATYLKNNKNIAWVNYPMLESDKNYNLAQKYTPKGASSIVSFGIKGGFKQGVKFVENLTLPFHVTNIGDTKTIVTYPSVSTHKQLSQEDKIKCGIGDDFIRLSVGLENVDDIIEDLDNALNIAIK